VIARRTALAAAVALAAIAPAAGCSSPFLSSETLSPTDFDDVVDEHAPTLATLRVGVLARPATEPSHHESSRDDATLLARHLAGEGVFERVAVTDEARPDEVDYLIDCSVECISTRDLHSIAAYLYGFPGLGLPFLFGAPYASASAFYVAEATFYRSGEDGLEPVGGSVAVNRKEWSFINLYWEPDFFDPGELEPLFDQVLADFLVRSGALAPREEP